MRGLARLSAGLLLLAALLATSCAEITDDELAVLERAARSAEESTSGASTAAPTNPSVTTAEPQPPLREGTPPEIEALECPFEEADLADVTCGTIELPGRGIDDDYTVDLAFARFHATGDAEDIEPDPVVFLHGGPGGAILDDAAYWYETIVAPHIETRDVILYDQRGGGLSTRLPSCYEVSVVGDRLALDVASHESLTAEFLVALDDCAARFSNRTDVDITAFNSAANAADLIDLLWALGITEYNIHGSSYGTRLAQTVMRDAPAGVRSVVLSGTYPIESNLMGSIPGSMESALTAVFDGCADSELCTEALPDPWATLEQLVKDLDASPMRVNVATTHDDSLSLAFDGTDLLNGLHSLLYIGYEAAGIPDLLIDHEDGDDRRIQRLAGSALFDTTDVATFLLVQCADEGPFTSTADLKRPLVHDFLRAIDLAPAVNGVDSLTICASWDTGSTDPIENEPVTWDVPTLLLAGAVDPITPPGWAIDLAARLPRSRLVIQAGAAHDSDESWCASRLIEDFVRNPDVLLDVACAAFERALPIPAGANRFRAPLEIVDTTLDVSGDGEFVDIRLPDWAADWGDDVHIRWRALDSIDPTAIIVIIVISKGSDYDPVEHLPFGDDVPDWQNVPRPFVPAGWTRWTMETTGGDLIRYVRDSNAVEIVLVLEPGEPVNLERAVLVPAARSLGAGS